VSLRSCSDADTATRDQHVAVFTYPGHILHHLLTGKDAVFAFISSFGAPLIRYRSVGSSRSLKYSFFTEICRSEDVQSLGVNWIDSVIKALHFDKSI
jgi:hypothetical protein